MALRVCCKYNSVLYYYIWWEIDELSSTPSHHTPSFAPTNHPYTLSIYLLYWGGLRVSQRVWGVGRGAELVNQPPYVVVGHRIILAANGQYQIGIPFILFSILSSLILWVMH